jgi:hypothetical protein
MMKGKEEKEMQKLTALTARRETAATLLPLIPYRYGHMARAPAALRAAGASPTRRTRRLTQM